MYETFKDRSTHLGNLFVTLKHFPRIVPKGQENNANAEQTCLRLFAHLSHTVPVSSNSLIIQ
jgi:hypothetical protein